MGSGSGAPEGARLEDVAGRRSRLFRALLDAQREIGEAVVILDGDRPLYANDAAAALTGYEPDELRGLGSLLPLVADEADRALLEAQVDRRLRGEQPDGRLEAVLARKDGRRVPVELGVAALDLDGRPGLLVVARDVSRRKGTEEALRRSEERFRALVQNASDVISIVDPDGTIRWQSPAADRLLGRPSEALAGTGLLALVHPEDAPRLAAALEGLGREPGAQVRVEYRVRRGDGSWGELEAVATSLMDRPSVEGIVVNARDVTERRAFEDQLARRAFYDPLTGLPNRVLFSYAAEHALGAARRDGLGVAVMFLDLDRFKAVNDTFGHDAGDQLLVAVARRLRAVVRPGDTVARLGGDEFVVLLEDIDEAGRAEAVARRVVERLDEPFTLDGRDARIGASVGIAFGTAEDATVADLLRFADAAMYRAKERGGARVATFDAPMRAEWEARAGLEADLREALDGGQLRVRYQPIADLATGRVAGVEALARWEHPTRGLLLPRDFLAVAEESGLIVELGERVLDEACRRAASWPPAGPDGAPPWVSVNLSTRQFCLPDLADRVAGALARAGLEPGRLRLEIGETTLMEDAGAGFAKVRALKALGVRLALDDFGTGYASLSCLRRRPVGALKLDPSLVGRLDEEGLGVVRAVAQLGRALGMEVAAEGVETPEQLARLRAADLDRAQGFLLAAPLDGPALDALLREGTPLAR